MTDTTVAMDDVAATVDADIEAAIEAARIPEVLSTNPILHELCTRYLAASDEIAAYNKEVLASKDSEWTTGKVMEKARLLASPTEKGVKPVAAVKKAVDQWEKLLTEVALARKNVIELTSKELGIEINPGTERNQEIEAPLREKRKIADAIGAQLKGLSTMLTNDDASDIVVKFLNENPLPVIGRDQAKNFGDDNGGVTPKYRVTVSVSKDGTQLAEFDGFTKAGMHLSKPQFGYARGESLKADKLREVWEANGAGKNTDGVVEFTDNDLHYVIKQK